MYAFVVCAMQRLMHVGRMYVCGNVMIIIIYAKDVVAINGCSCVFYLVKVLVVVVLLLSFRLDEYCY